MNSQLQTNSMVQSLNSKLDYVRNIVSGNGTLDLNDVKITIKSGLLAGCERVADKSSIVIGSDADADIMLLDDHVEPQHGLIIFSSDFRGLKIGVKALSPTAIKVKNHPDVAPGETGVFRDYVEIVCADVHIEIAHKNAVIHKMGNEGGSLAVAPNSEIAIAKNKSSLIKIIPLLGLPAILFILSYFLLFSNWHFDIGSKNISEMTSKSAPQKSPAEFFEMLKAQVQKEGLGGQVVLSMRPGGGIEAKGEPSEDQMYKWLNVFQWYDQQKGAPVLFNNVMPAPDIGDLPQIKYASFGAEPYLILASGAKLRVGETADNKWLLSSISDQEVSFSFSNKTIKIKLE